MRLPACGLRSPVALLLALTISACSIGIKAPAPDWDGTNEPDCTDSNGLVVADGLGGGLLFGAGLVAAKVSVDAADQGTPNTSADVIALGGMGLGLVFIISALIGESKYKRCHEAYAQWRIGGAIGRASVKNTGTTPAATGDAKQAEQAVQGAAEAAKPQPRGYFCSSSPSNATAGFCVRDKAECQRTLDAAIVGVSDLSECALTERAFCFGERCAPTAEACGATRLRVVGPDGTGPDCAASE